MFYYFSKLLERTLAQLALGYEIVTCTSFWRIRADLVSCDRSHHSRLRYNVNHFQVVKNQRICFVCVDPYNAVQSAVSEDDGDSLRACCQTNNGHMIFVGINVEFEAGDDFLELFQETLNFVSLVLA